MPSNKLIKRRLESVKTTKKIMRALDMVAASKLQNCKVRLEHARGFLSETENTLGGIEPVGLIMDNSLISSREVNKVAYMVIAGNRGMCGSYNSGVLDAANRHMREYGKENLLVTIGVKAYEHYMLKQTIVHHDFSNMLETAFYEDAVRISHFLRNLYLSGDVDEVYVVYTEFESAFVHSPRVKRLIPVEVGFDFNESCRPMEYDQGVVSFMDHAIPAFLNTFVYASMLESIACENAARMLSMDAAVNNATDIIDKLTLSYNRKRQAAITQEINEIISGWQ